MLFATKILLILGLIVELGFAQFPKKTFSCRNGEYIESDQFCDQRKQCFDGSDEPENCSSNKRNCGVGKFYCPSKKLCINVDDFSDIPDETLCRNQNSSDSVGCSPIYDESYRSILKSITSFFNKTTFFCDDKRCLDTRVKIFCSCLNFSDSKNSNKDTIPILLDSKNCSFQNEKFLCNDSKRCLNLEYVCDGYCNCFDCSDEHHGCNKIDREKLDSCPDLYFPTPEGPKCISNSSKILVKTDHSKIDDDNLTKCTICDQKCTKYERRAICSCDQSYTKVLNGGHGFRCQSKEWFENATLIYSTKNMIKSLNFFTGIADVIEHTESTVFTAVGDDLYYTTYKHDNKIIFKYSKQSHDTENRTIQNIYIDSPITSIAVDYITNVLYFTTNNTLSVCSNFIICKHLFNDTEVNYSYVALTPLYRWMFYVKKLYYEDGYSIMRSNMNGSEEVFLIDGNYRQPTPLAVDESIKRIYWLNQEIEEIISASFFSDDSEIRKFQYKGNVISITALDSKLFFTKYGDNEIYILENNENFVKSIGENAKITRYRYNFHFEGLLNSTISGEYLIEDDRTLAVLNLFAYNPAQQSKLKGKNDSLFNASCIGQCQLRPNLANWKDECSTSEKNRCWNATSGNFIENTQEKNSKSENTIESGKSSSADIAAPKHASKQSDDANKKSDDSTKQSHDANKKSDDSTTQSDNANKKSDDSTTQSNNANKKSDVSTTQSDNANKKSDDSTTQSESATSPSKPSTDSLKLDRDNESTVGWQIIGAIILVAFVIYGVYFYKRRRGYSHFSFRHLGWRRYNNHINIHDQEDL